MENAVDEKAGGSLAESSNGTLPMSYERVPRGRCQPPVAPAPNPRRGELMIMKKKDVEAQSSSTGGVIRSSGRHPSKIVMMTKGRRTAPRKPMPKWKMGYVGFKRKVTVSCCATNITKKLEETCPSHNKKSKINFSTLKPRLLPWMDMSEDAYKSVRIK